MKKNNNNNNGKLTLVAKSRRKQTVCNIYGYIMWSLVCDFSENDKIFCREKNTLNNERYRDLLISILSYDEVSAFLLWVKARN